MTRQGRIHFHKTDNPYPLEMIQQGIEALEALHRFPALTSWQVCKLLFLARPNSQGAPRGEVAAKRAVNHYCLRRLKDRGLVKVKAIPRLDNPMAKWEMNYLTKSGHDLLVSYRQNLNLATSPYRPVSLSYQTINNHSMTIIDAAVSALAYASLSGLGVDVYLDHLTIRSMSKTHALDWPMEPDALLVFSYGPVRRAFFLEADMGTESVDSTRANSWRTKMEKYRHYSSALRQTDPLLHHLPQPDVMVITPSDRRPANLLETTRMVGGRTSYWFTTQELILPPYSFFGSVWQRIGLDGYYSPIERFSS